MGLRRFVGLIHAKMGVSGEEDIVGAWVIPFSYEHSCLVIKWNVQEKNNVQAKI